MTPRTLFTIILKVFGIYLLYSALVVIPQGIGTIVTVKNMFGEDNTWIVYTILMTVIVLVLYYALLHILLYKTDWVINKLALTEHFTEEKFELNLHRSTILRIAVIAVGALIFIDAVPLLCRQIFVYIQTGHASATVGNSEDAQWVIYYFVETFIGYFLMTSSRLVVNFIERQRKKDSTQLSEEKILP